VLRLPLAGLAVALALAASACGGSGGGGAGGTDPGKYAASVCGALVDWQTTLQNSGTEMSSGLSSSSTPSEVKSKFVDFMSAAVDATETLQSKAKSAGPPDVKDGEKFQADLDGALDTAVKAFKNARDKAKQLPTSDTAAFQSQASALGQTLTQEGNKISTQFNGLSGKYDSKDLNDAFDKEPSCKNVSS
jgi:hypothetical protein